MTNEENSQRTLNILASTARRRIPTAGTCCKDSAGSEIPTEVLAAGLERPTSHRATCGGRLTM